MTCHDILDSPDCMDNAGDFSATFLPILTPPKYCKDKQDKLNSPIVIAWASRLGCELFYFDEPENFEFHKNYFLAL